MCDVIDSSSVTYVLFHSLRIATIVPRDPCSGYRSGPGVGTTITAAVPSIELRNLLFPTPRVAAGTPVAPPASGRRQSLYPRREIVVSGEGSDFIFASRARNEFSKAGRVFLAFVELGQQACVLKASRGAIQRRQSGGDWFHEMGIHAVERREGNQSDQSGVRWTLHCAVVVCVS